MNSKQTAECLMGELLPFAKNMLKEHGEFLPFGGWITTEGAMVHAGAMEPNSEQPKSIEIIRIIQDELRKRARLGEIQASGIVFDVRVFVPNLGQNSDAIQLNLDHQSGYSAEVFLPYTLEESGNPLFGEIFAQAGKSEIFATI